MGVQPPTGENSIKTENIGKNEMMWRRGIVAAWSVLAASNGLAWALLEQAQRPDVSSLFLWGGIGAGAMWIVRLQQRFDAERKPDSATLPVDEAQSGRKKRREPDTNMFTGIGKGTDPSSMEDPDEMYRPK